MPLVDLSPVCLQMAKNVASTLLQADWYFSGSAIRLSTEFKSWRARQHQVAVQSHQSSHKFDLLICACDILGRNSEETDFEISQIRLDVPFGILKIDLT
jgi:hypothetical protein